MKKLPTLAIEKGRIINGPYGSSMADGCNGAFTVRGPAYILHVMASDGTDDESQGWEHVSVSTPTKTPSWRDMAWVKDQFWEEHESCFQLHPPVEDYINFHPFCLHIWRHKVIPTPRPPIILVGPRT